jgi:hypothetical protein
MQDSIYDCSLFNISYNYNNITCHASPLLPVCFRHKNTDINYSFHPVEQMQLSRGSSSTSVAQLHIDVLKLCPTCNIKFSSLKVKALPVMCEHYCALHK